MERHAPFYSGMAPEHLWTTFDHLFDGFNIVYFPTPISTGTRFVKWWEEKGRALHTNIPEYTTALLQDVIIPNKLDAKIQMAGHYMRRTVSDIYVCPALTDLTGWSHDDCMKFWLRFIVERRFSRLKFLEGWQTSLGCVLEFNAAHRAKIPCVNSYNIQIMPSDVLKIMWNHIENMQLVKMPYEGYLNLYQEMGGRVPVK